MDIVSLTTGCTRTTTKFFNLGTVLLSLLISGALVFLTLSAFSILLTNIVGAVVGGVSTGFMVQ